MLKLLIVIIFFIAKPVLANDFDNLHLIGKAQLNFALFKIYDIELRGESKKFSYDHKLAIKINYNKDFSKKELIKVSIDEIARINQIDRKIVEESYSSILERLLVDVKKGDEKVAIYDPNFGLTLFYNSKLIGRVNDKIFARRFIDIWLSDKAKFIKVRNSLIGS